MDYYPLHLWLQVVGDFGEEKDEPVQTFNLELMHAQVGEHITNPRYVDEQLDAHLRGTFVVQEKEWQEHKTDGLNNVPRNLMIYLRKI